MKVGCQTYIWEMLGAAWTGISVVSVAARAAKRFNGWLIVEEESVEAGRDPAAAVRRNRETIRTSMGR